MMDFPLEPLFEALANSLWRGMLLVAVTAISLRLFRRTTAAERHGAWLAVLLVIAIAPAVETVSVWLVPIEQASPVIVRPYASPPAVSTVSKSSGWAFSPVVAAASPLLLVWLVIVGLLAIRLAWRCRLACLLKRDSEQPCAVVGSQLATWERRLNSPRPSETRLTTREQSMAAVGWMRPVVLLPEGCEQQPGWDDTELLWRHEKAHLSRWDDWTQLVTESLVVVMWFHPAVYWIKRELERERELACDEAVIGSGVDSGEYARALGRWAERAALGELPVGAMGIGRSRSQIVRRIEMLLSPSSVFRHGGTRWLFVVGLAAAAALLAALTVTTPQLVRAQSVVEPVVEVSTPVQLEVPVVVAVPVDAVEPDEVERAVRVVVPPVPPVAPAPVLIGQAAVAPPAPPVPPRPPAPIRVDEDRIGEHEQARKVHEQVQRMHEEMRPHIEAIQEEASNIQAFVEEHIAPHQEKIHELATTFTEVHMKELAPLIEEMSTLGREIGSAVSDAEREQLGLRMDELSEQMEAREPELRERLERAMAELELNMEPFQERLRDMEAALREKEEALHGVERRLEEAVEGDQ